MSYKVEAPLATFNNFIYELSNELSEIFDCNLSKSNNILFLDDSIVIFGYIKLYFENNDFKIFFKKPISPCTLKYYKITQEKYSELSNIYYKYSFMINDIMNNHDLNISENYVNSIIEDTKNIKSEKVYLIPFRHKIANDINDNETLKNLYNKFSYGLKLIRNNGNQNFKYNILRMISSDLDESKCIANIKLLDVDIIATGYVVKDDIKEFLKDLLFYGKLRNIKETAI